jgi:iron-sulfur cluster assembly protein
MPDEPSQPQSLDDIVSLTPVAAEKVRGFLEKERKDPAEYGFRIGIMGGGCSGFQYALGLEKPEPGDLVSLQHGVKVIVDFTSAPYLRGTIIDYAESLMGSGFSIQNPNARGSCGCGQSFGV